VVVGVLPRVTVEQDCQNSSFAAKFWKFGRVSGLLAVRFLGCGCFLAVFTIV